MSWEATAWALPQHTGSPTRKAVLLALANRHNHDTGRCDPHLDLIAEDTELSVRTVERAAKDLCDVGLITRERRRRKDGSLAGYVYRFPHVPPRVSQPPVTESGSPPDRVSGQELEVDLEPEILVEPDGSTRTRERPSVALAVRAIGQDGPKTVAKKPVTVGELFMARTILAEWNRAAGQDLRSHDWLTKIILRIREYPEASIADHVLIIETALRHPWWKGPPSPSVVYGNGAQFERAVQQVKATGGVDEDERIARLVNEAVAKRRSA